MEMCLAKQNDAKIVHDKHVKYKMQCSYETHSCFYVVDCKPGVDKNGKPVYQCDQKAHFIDYLGICCYPKC